MFKKSIKKQKGITLIALVITIIVLLILAGVTIAAINSNESAPNKAVEARAENDKGAMKDAAALKAVSLVQEYMDKKYVTKQSLGDGIVTAGDYVASQIVGTERGYTYAVSTKTLTVTDTKGNTVTGTILENGNISWGANSQTPTEPTEPETPVEPLEIGDTVNYSTSLNGVTLKDWSVFYVDGDYTYIILADYLPNSAINTNSLTGIATSGTYGIWSSDDDRITLINALLTKSNWD